MRLGRCSALAAFFLSAATSALASHPLITEDTGVLGAGRFQVELHGERVRDEGRRTSHGALVFSYGVSDEADFQLELPEGDDPAAVSVKWRFLERDAVRLVLKPDVHEDGGWAANFVAGYEIGRVELLAHAGYLRNRTAGERRSLTHASAAAVLAATRRLKLVLDFSRDTNPDPDSRTPLREVVYGLTYELSRHAELGLGLKRGRSEPADDRALLAGVKLRF